MRKRLLTTLSVICLLCCFSVIGLAIQNSALADTVPTVTVQDGASVRLSTTDAGIRFTAEISDYSEDYTYGMYIFPADYLDGYTSGSKIDYAVARATELGKTLKGGDCTPYLKGSTYMINGALVNLKYGNLNRDFVAIAYVKDSGNNYTYSDVSVARNIVWVSGAAIEKGGLNSETELSIVNNFVKLGYYKAVGEAEATATAAENLPEISVEGSTTVYAGLWAQPTPTFTYNSTPVANGFNPYASTVTEGLSYSNNLVKGFETGNYTLSYENISGTYGVTVRDLDETPVSEYCGIYGTVNKSSAVITDVAPLVVNGAQNAEVTLVKGSASRGLAAGTEYTVTESGISVGGNIIESQYGLEPLYVYVLNGNTANICRTVYVKDYFANATDYTQVFKFITGGATGLARSNVNGKMRITSGSNGAINGRYYTTGFDIEYLKLAYAAGYYCLEFDVTVDASFANYANKGIRVYSSRQTNAVDGGGIQTGTSGVYLYKDFGTDVTEATTFTVKVVLADFLALDASANQLRFVISTAKDGKVDFSNFRIRNDRTIEETKADLENAYAFNYVNSQTTANGGKWDVAQGGIMGKNYNAEKDAMAINMVNSGAAINGRYFVTYTSIDMLTNVLNAGFNTISFNVSSDDGAFTGEGRGIRVFSKKNSGLDGYAIQTYSVAGIYVYGDYGTAANTTEFTVTIDIYDFLTKSMLYTPNYLGIVMNIPANTTAYFSGFTVAKYTPEQLTAIYAFNSVNSQTTANGGKWDVAQGGIMGKNYNAEKDAMAINMVNANAAINGRYYVMYTSIDMVAKAQIAGINAFSFTVSSDDGAFTDAGRGIRVFSKASSGLDGVAIQDGQTGIHEYGDYGTDAGTTEFTVTVDIDDFMALNPSAGYLGIVMNIPANTTAYFSDMTFGIFASFKIAVSDSATDAEVRAANELKTYLETATDKLVRVENESDVSGSEIIYVGRTDAFDTLSIADFDEEHLNGDGFVITGSNGSLYIAGATDKGTINGIYYFLEEYIGVKFYGIDSTVVPSIDSVSFTAGTVRKVPDFKYRGVLTDSTMHVNAGQGRTADKVAEYYAQTGQSHEFLQDAAQTVVDENYGGSINLFKGINQTHNNLTYVDPDTYYASYPSMFYVSGNPVDICYSSGINADGTIASGTNAASVYVNSLKAYISANPDVEYFVMGQEDISTHCTCSACNSGSTTYGYGEYTAVVLRFYNTVAKEIYAWETANDRDHVKLVIFSYLFSTKAPVQQVGNEYSCHSTVVLAENIVIRFADFWANVYLPFTDANQVNGYGADYLDKWAPVIGDNEVWFWDYATNSSYYFAYTPSLQKISAVLDALDDLNTQYVFIQHSTSENNDWRAKMESYVINKLLWGGTQTIADLRDEYIEGYYGVASDYIKDFVDNFDTCMAAIAGNASTRNYFLYDIMSISDDRYEVEDLVTANFLSSQLALLDQALAAINASELDSTEKAILIARVNAVKVTPLFYLAYSADRYYDNDSDKAAARSAFISLCESLGITAYGEHRYVSALKTEWGL